MRNKVMKVMPTDQHVQPALPQSKDERSLEATSMAYELASSYKHFVEFYRREYGLEVAEADAKTQELLQPGNEQYEDRLRHGPPQDATWFELAYLAETDPAAADARW